MEKEKKENKKPTFSRQNVAFNLRSMPLAFVNIN